MKSKKFWESKTFWVNALFVIAGVSTALAGELEAGSTITAVGCLNILLRILTKVPIKM